ncbi:MAG: hypothetical protein IKP06_05525 [Elusimicrobiaceae bacterium]|nr:hypothetical protein [Elusimicrobiaceae bacterium]
MINLPSELLKLQQGHDLRPLKPFVLLYRNKWDEQTNKYVVEDTPIDVTLMVIKPNTLSMTLDVNEVAQYNANNITLTLSDKNNRFVEGTPQSYFPEGYQLYGSRMVLYYGISTNNRTELFTGAIKDLPTYKPELHQVDIKLVSPLELLKDMEAKGFSNSIIGESLIYSHRDSENHPVYRTNGLGVGGVVAVYMDGTRIAEGADYMVSQLNTLGFPALVTIINNAISLNNLTVDYYTWHTGLTVEQVVAGLARIAGYENETAQIRNVVWHTAVRNYISNIQAVMGIGYYKDGDKYAFNWLNTRDGVWHNTTATGESRIARRHILPENFETEFNIRLDFNGGSWGGTHAFYEVGTSYNGSILSDGLRAYLYRNSNGSYHLGFDIATGGRLSNDIWSREFSGVSYIVTQRIKIRKLGAQWYLYINGEQVSTFTKAINADYDFLFSSVRLTWSNLDQVWRALDANGNPIGPDMYNPGILTATLDKTDSPTSTWGAIGIQTEGSANSRLTAYFSNDGTTFDGGTPYESGAIIGRSERYLRYLLEIGSAPAASFTIVFQSVYYLNNTLLLQLVNLTGLTVLEALQNFALISGYEFGVSRNGIFFFRPRVQTAQPIYDLDHAEVVHVDSIKKDLSDFFTKLTLIFAETPLEFYANEGERPTPIDRYGIVNKEIDKPEILNFDNPELAQAIGPQLLEIYSDLRNQLQVTAKLNLSLELGDIVNLKRSYPQTADKNASDLNKYERQQTYYRACKIVGINYNFAKKQMSYTLRDVSDNNNKPQAEFYEFVYDLPIQLGVK